MKSDKLMKRRLIKLTMRVSFFLVAVLANNIYADVVLDGTLGASGTIAAIDNTITITDAQGQLKGSNLFHSFSQFNIDSGEVATFTGPSSVQNIVSRITGGESTINGGITSEIPGANLWLLNPAGLLFGDGASVNIMGSFHVSTADYILSQNGDRFSADPGANLILSSSSPQSFGFLDQNLFTAKIEVKNVKIKVPENSSISVLSSDVSLQGAFLSAPGGNISVVSINDSGKVIYSDQGLDISSIKKFGDLRIDSSAFIVNGAQKGSLQLKGGNLEKNSSDTNFISSVTNLKTSFLENENLLEKPCELAEFYDQGKISFTINLDEEETEYGVKTTKNRNGPIGAIDVPECL